MGVALSLAAWSKASALGVIPLAIIAVALVPAYGRESIGLRRSLGLTAASLAVVLIAVGPWYARSLGTFGDVLGVSPHAAMPWARADPISLEASLAAFPGVLPSFWLAFGWGVILAPDGVYQALNALGAIGLVGATIGYRRSRDRKERGSILLLTAWPVVIIVALVRWNQLFYAALGRLTFPAISALGVLVAFGWCTLSSTFAGFARRASVAALPAVLLLALSIVSVPALLAPAFASPSLLSQAQIERQPGRPIDVRYGSVARLIRIDVPRGGWPRPGDQQAVSLCWEALARDTRELLVFVHFVGEQNRLVAVRRTHPGRGNYPTSIWQPGARFCDIVQVPVSVDAPAPAVYHVEVGIFDHQTLDRLPAYAPGGTLLGSNFVDLIKVAPETYASPSIETPLQFRLGEQIELVGFALDPFWAQPQGSVNLRLYWRALRRPDADYTVFVHMRDEGGQTAAQADGPPRAGAYPTSFWDAGEVVIDDRPIAMPAAVASGQYAVVIGLYEPVSGERLTISGSARATEIVLPARIDVRPISE